MNYYVEIVEHETEKVVKRMGPFPEYKADKVMTGAEINLDHERYYVRTAKAES